MTTRIVLVPGFWMGAWAWDDLLPHLHDAFPAGDVETEAVTLPGREGAGEGPAEVSLEDQATAMITALDHPADTRVLVVHSGAAFPGTLVLDRRPDLVDRMVLVDTAVVGPGVAFNAEQSGDFTLADAWAGLEGEGSFTDLTEEQLATFRERAVPERRTVVSQAVELENDQRHRVPLTVICTLFPSSAYRDYAAQGVPYLAALLDYDDVTYVDLPTGHWPMWSKPKELAALIAEAAGA